MTTTPTGISYLKSLMEKCNHGSIFDLHDAYGVGARQAATVLLRLAEGLTHEALNDLTAQFRLQGKDAVCLMAIAPEFAYCVREQPMCIAHAATDPLVQQGVDCGRALVLASLVDSYVARPRRLTTEDIHRVGMEVYAWLMNLAAQQLDDDSYEVWHAQWCQTPGRMPWQLSEYGQEAEIHITTHVLLVM